jgi:hypothetical protein
VEVRRVSFICRMVVGYFDPARVYGRVEAVNRPLNSKTVGRLQAACDDLFGVQLRLADYLTEPGVLVIEGGVITRDMFRVACTAHELFGMTAVDNAHRDVVYPRPAREPEPIERLVQPIRELRPDWDESRVRQEAECWHQRQVRQAEFERGVIRRVRAAREQRQAEPGAAPDHRGR